MRPALSSMPGPPRAAASGAIHGVLRELSRDESIVVSVSGQCMLPWVEHGARVRVTAAKRYWPGDVVVARSGQGGYLVHRVIGSIWRRGGLRVITQADAAARPDTAVVTQAILGRVTGGDCHVQARVVPLAHRVGASARFVTHIARYVLGRLRRRC